MSRARLAWLRRELERWSAEGLIDRGRADEIIARYDAGGRGPAARVLLGLGALIAGVGSVWLVAANLDWDRVSPLGRFTVSALFWLACVGVAEAAHRWSRPHGGAGSALAGALQALAAIAFGGAVFQVAQSLQVPAYEPALLGAWAAGSLLYAYAVRGATALVVALVVGVAWLVWQLAERADTATAFLAGLVIAGPGLLAIAALHERAGAPRFARPWRAIAAACTLGAVLVASLPGAIDGDQRPPGVILWAAGVALALAVLAWVRADRLSRIELLACVATAVSVLVLFAVAPDVRGRLLESTPRGGADLAITLAASCVFLAVAVGLAVLGTIRSAPELRNIALGGLLLFVALQSFATIAPIVSGGTLFLVVGLLMLVAGVALQRAGRRLAEAVEG